MERKIYINIFLVSIIAMFITTFTLSLLFYDYYLNIMEDNLISIIEIYDESNSNIDNLNLQNNISIKKYIKDEIPSKINSNIYYDKNLNTSEILRFEANIVSLKYIFFSSFSIFIAISIFIIVFLHIVSSYLTNELMVPIKIASESIENIIDDKPFNTQNIYPEFQPFISNINLSKKRIEYYIIKLEKNEQFRREFTANISHELKTPLTSINGYAELLKYNLIDSKDISNIGNIIYEEGLRLLEMIDDIIKLSNLENAEISPVLSEVNLLDIIYKVSNNLSLRMKNKNLTFNLSAKPIVLKGDFRMIEDLIYNLIDNSIKYNKFNGIINIDLNEDDDYIIFIIQDTGIGISNSDINRVFERFYMIDKSRSQKYKSTGLGLAIVKHIVDIHNGKIEIYSKLNQGTLIKIKFKK